MFYQAKEICEILHGDPGALFPPPATKKDFAECYADLKALALPHFFMPNPLPKGLMNFLKQHNGFSWNGIEFFGAQTIYRPDGPSAYKLMDIVRMNLDYYRNDTVFHEKFGDMCGSSFLVFGRADEDIYMYNSKTEKYEVRDRTDREVYEEYDGFAAFFEHVVGGRLGLYPLDDEDPDEAQYEHDEGRYDGEI